VEIDVAFQLNGRDRRLDPGGHDHLPSPVARTGVDGFLDGSGVRTDVMTRKAIVHHIIDARSLVHGRSDGRQEPAEKVPARAGQRSPAAWRNGRQSSGRAPARLRQSRDDRCFMGVFSDQRGRI
jgi:hypothetical protein